MNNPTIIALIFFAFTLLVSLGVLMYQYLQNTATTDGLMINAITIVLATSGLMFNIVQLQKPIEYEYHTVAHIDITKSRQRFVDMHGTEPDDCTYSKPYWNCTGKVLINE